MSNWLDEFAKVVSDTKMHCVAPELLALVRAAEDMRENGWLCRGVQPHQASASNCPGCATNEALSSLRTAVERHLEKRSELLDLDQ
jgi:hypothetical protein